MTQRATIEIATELLSYALQQPPDACVVGDVTAAEMARFVSAALEEHDAHHSERRTTADGRPAVEADLTIDPATGQQRDYIVLSAEERAKGFVRPVRKRYVHAKCGGLTIMTQALAETYAREPSFYSGTFCCHCREHFPVGPSGEFTWDGTDEKVGT